MVWVRVREYTCEAFLRRDWFGTVCSISAYVTSLKMSFKLVGDQYKEINLVQVSHCLIFATKGNSVPSPQLLFLLLHVLLFVQGSNSATRM